MVSSAQLTARQKWRQLSERNRRLIVVAGIAEAGLKAAALVDLKRRPAAQVRGSKVVWTGVVVVVNSFGLAPLSYLAFGRRP